MPAIQPAELWRSPGAGSVRQGAAAHQGPPRARLLLRPDPRGGHHRPGARATCKQLPPAAGQPLPDPDQVPRRDPAALRPDARARVHHEGRLLLPRRRARASTRPTRRCATPTARIFEACGLDYTVVEADTGTIGGSASHEFMVLAETGESAVVRCRACGYARQRREGGDGRGPGRRPPRRGAADATTCARSPTPGQRIDRRGRRRSLGLEPRAAGQDADLRRPTTGLGGGRWSAATARSTRSSSRTRSDVAATCALAERASRCARATGAPVGFAGPVGLRAGVRAASPTSRSRGLRSFVAGANQADAHYTGVNWGRDAEPAAWADLRAGARRRPLPALRQRRCEVYRGIEVGHIFKLGTKYSEAMSCDLHRRGRRRACR